MKFPGHPPAPSKFAPVSKSVLKVAMYIIYDGLLSGEGPQDSPLQYSAGYCTYFARKLLYKLTGSQICGIVPLIGNLNGAQRLINLEIPVLVRSLKSSNVGLG